MYDSESDSELVRDLTRFMLTSNIYNCQLEPLNQHTLNKTTNSLEFAYANNSQS